MRVLQEAGVRIPQDVAVIGFDDIDEARYSLPSLSTIDPGREEIAEVAIRFLKERIDASDRDDPRPRTPLGLPPRSARVHDVAALPSEPLDTVDQLVHALYNVFL